MGVDRSELALWSAASFNVSKHFCGGRLLPTGGCGGGGVMFGRGSGAEI